MHAYYFYYFIDPILTNDGLIHMWIFLPLTAEEKMCIKNTIKRGIDKLIFSDSFTIKMLK